MQRYIDKIALGIQGEKFILNRLDKLLGKRRQRRNYRIEHNSFNRSKYPMGTGLDLKVFRDDKPLIDAEVKNWNWFNRPYGTEFAKEILDRFIGSIAPIKLLFISYVSLLTHAVIELIKKAGITIIEIGATIQPHESWGQHLIQFQNRNYYKLRKLLLKTQTTTQKNVGCFNVVRLIRFVDLTDTNSINPSNNNNYDTHIAKLEYKRNQLNQSIENG